MAGGVNRRDVRIAQTIRHPYNGLAMESIGQSKARTECLKVTIGQTARAYTTLAISGVDQDALQATRARIGLGGIEIAPVIVLAGWRQIVFPAEPEIQHQIRANTPVILNESGERRPLLSDIAQSRSEEHTSELQSRFG